MTLVLIAVISGKQVPLESRFLVIAILAVTTGAGTGFLGGRAKANGNLDIPLLNTPIQVGLTGGIATLVIMMLLGNYLYPSQARLTDKEPVNQEVIDNTIAPDRSANPGKAKLMDKEPLKEEVTDKKKPMKGLEKCA